MLTESKTDAVAGELLERVREHIEFIYQDETLDKSSQDIAAEIFEAIRGETVSPRPVPHLNKWSQRDAVLITYGDSILSESRGPLQSLKKFLDTYIRQQFSSVHVLPFFPYSSDDGFSIIDFSSVNESLGDWTDIQNIARDYKLMADVVINHCSSKGKWFENFTKGISPGADYFLSVDPTLDLSEVVRPRTSPLLRETETPEGTKHVWCTFSHDQVDLNFRNPDVLIQIVRLVRLYLDRGVRVFRLDAVAFIWKDIKTRCLNLEQAHEIVRLIRTLVDYVQEDVLIITETNIPSRENLSYFGNGNEAHCIYNFSLPPLLIHALLTGSCRHLKQWMMSMPPAMNGTAYLNFIASHDGIGLRPVEGLLSESEIHEMITCLQRFGALVSWRAESGRDKPYEINIALYDAFKGTVNGKDQWRDARMLLAHTIMISLEGIPAIYIHSLLATENDSQRAHNSGNARAINRHKWNEQQLVDRLETPESPQARMLTGICELIKKRSEQPAFHPNATQFTLHLGEAIFGFWRQSRDRSQSIFCVFNLTQNSLPLSLSNINLIETDHWHDILTGREFKHIGDTVQLLPYQALWITNWLLPQ